jgi:hypothetical protein
MCELITIKDISHASSPSTANKVLERATMLCEQLEAPSLLKLPFLPFDIKKEEMEFLINCDLCVKRKSRKVIYKPYFCNKSKTISKAHSANDSFLFLMQKYFFEAYKFLSRMLVTYSKSWQVGYSQFCGFSEDMIKSNKALHFDIFDEHPASGHRILRFCINICPDHDFLFEFGDDFSTVMNKHFNYDHFSDLELTKNTFLDQMKKTIVKYFGVPISLRTPYDIFLSKLAVHLQDCNKFQKFSKRKKIILPPNSCLIFFSDTISHMPISDSNIIAHTFLIPNRVLTNQQNSPVNIVKSFDKQKMILSKI